MYQNFDFINNVKQDELEYFGGSVTLADFCPFIQEFTWRSKNVIVRGSQCQFEDNNPSNCKLYSCLSIQPNNKPRAFCILFKLTEPEKNFALESYGNHSKCFDHTDNMWEERSCRQTREWQHWGSGCYRYRCENGRLHIMVNKTNWFLDSNFFVMSQFVLIPSGHKLFLRVLPSGSGDYCAY